MQFARLPRQWKLNFRCKWNSMKSRIFPKWIWEWIGFFVTFYTFRLLAIFFCCNRENVFEYVCLIIMAIRGPDFIATWRLSIADSLSMAPSFLLMHRWWSLIENPRDYVAREWNHWNYKSLLKMLYLIYAEATLELTIAIHNRFHSGRNDQRERKPFWRSAKQKRMTKRLNWNCFKLAVNYANYTKKRAKMQSPCRHRYVLLPKWKCRLDVQSRH